MLTDAHCGMKLTRLLAVALAFVVSACARPPTCDNQFVGGQAPIVHNENLAKKTRPLCYREFAVLHSGVSRTPLYSAEHLTREQIQQARGMKRKNEFHAEESLPASERAELQDYSHSGYDRGHMAPSGDMPNEKAQRESFTLANMIPQHPKNNQLIWAAIEEGTRNLTLENGELYVITGPLFEGQSLERLNGRVLIPTHVYKAIYDPTKNQGSAYLTQNAPGMAYQTLSLAELEKRIGINLFPKLPDDVKANKMALPSPVPHNPRSRNKPKEVENLNK